MTASIHWLDTLSTDEVRELSELRDSRAWLSVAVNWGLIFASFGLVIWVPHVLTILLALFVVGGRQLGLAVLMHEASHRSLLRKRELNDWVGNWLCAYPIWADLKPYRHYHLAHHAHTWTDADPDVGLARPFPVTRASLGRKIWRDLSGQTGWKRTRAVLNRDLGHSRGKTFRGDEAGWRTLIPVAGTNAVLFSVLWLLGWGPAYLLWVAAWMTTYSLAMRIRSIAEHSMPTDPANQLCNTRTLKIRPWERLLIGPNYVNYHLEHHLIISVPHYNLPRLHRLLEQRGALSDALIGNGYVELLARASSRPA